VVDAAGGNMTSIAQLLCALQRDWSRMETKPVLIELE